MNEDQRISRFQLFALMVRAMIGVSILTAPSFVAKDIGHNGWISVLIAGVVISALFLIIQKLISYYPNEGLVMVLQKTWGKLLGSLFVFMIIGYLVYLTSFITRIYADNLSTWFLSRTPIVVLLVMTILMKTYCSVQTIPGFIRFTELAFVLTLPLLLLILPTYGEARWVYLRPFLGQDLLNRVVLPTYKVLPMLAGFEIAIFYGYLVKKKQNLARVGLGAVAFAVIIYCAVIVAGVVFFGPTMLSESLHPVSDALRAIPFPVIERLDMFFIFFWNFALFSTGNIYFYTGVMLTRDVLGIPREQRLWASLALGLVCIGWAWSQDNAFMDTGFTAQSLIMYGGYLSILVLTTIVAKFRSQGGSANG